MDEEAGWPGRWEVLADKVPSVQKQVIHLQKLPCGPPFSGLFSASYGPAIASIDFHIRLKKSREFLIGQNNWIMSY